MENVFEVETVVLHELGPPSAKDDEIASNATASPEDGVLVQDHHVDPTPVVREVFLVLVHELRHGHNLVCHNSKLVLDHVL